MRLTEIFGDGVAHVRQRTLGLYAVIIGINLLIWVGALAAFWERPVLLSMALLAYGLGLRHAFDADHIVAIDNIARKLMQENKRPVAAGFFFSLGHSTVVFLLTALIVVMATMLRPGLLASVKDVGSVVGTGVSASFLLAIAVVNLFVLKTVWNNFQAIRHDRVWSNAEIDRLLDNAGWLSKVSKRLSRMIKRSWHLYPLGFLFGLGFDTATEIGLLGIAATQAANGMSLWLILLFPALFAAGMSLMDTADGILMMEAYGWAFVQPLRKLYYNFVMTLLSVVMAFVVSGIEVASMLEDRFDWHGGFWVGVAKVNDHFGAMGYVIVGTFMTLWLGSTIAYRFKYAGKRTGHGEKPC